MLKKLEIKNFIIVDELEVDFDTGLTVLTGETGAGKSILLEALSLATGKRAETSYAKNSAKKATITAIFEINENKHAKQMLRENGLDEEICILRRMLDNDGKSKAFCNDEPVTLSFLKKISLSLLDIHSQHQSQSLLKPDSQRKYIDDSAGNSDLVGELTSIYKSYQSNVLELNGLSKNNSDEQQLELLNHLISEFEDNDLDLSEINTIEDEHKRLNNSKESSELFLEVSALLEGSENNASGIIERSLNLLSKLNSDESKSIENNLTIAHEHLLNASRILSEQAQLELGSESKLFKIENKLSDLHNLARKHKCQIGELNQAYKKLKDELTQANNKENLINKIKGELSEQKKEYFKLAKKVRKTRKTKSAELGLEINRRLKNLGLPHAELIIDIEEIDQEEPLPNGMEAIEFRIKTNPSQEPLSLSKIASGGELSRVSLALQSAIAVQSNIPASIYDEVDSGIGGNTAKIVGKNLKQISKKNQVICITHSAQVACAGNHHFSITKRQNDNDTIVKIEYLNVTAREKEIARMLGNTEQEKVAIEHARQLLQDAT